MLVSSGSPIRKMPLNKNSAHTLCLVGADTDLTHRIQTLLAEQLPHLESRWGQADQANADLLIIDTDSVYGHMDWLRAQSSERRAIICTQTPAAYAAELHLRKPINAAEFVETLNRASRTLGSTQKSPAPVRVEAGIKESPKAAPPVEPAPEAEKHPLTLLDLLGDSTPLTGRTRLSAPGLPQIHIDPAARQWHSDATLKSLGAWCTRTLAPSDLQDMSDTEFATAVATLPSQPHTRLVWLAHLISGAGQLRHGLDPAGVFKLARWPQSEREFPKHFRIATVMLKQAASIDDIAAQSTATPAEVADFVNAYHALGFVEHETSGKPIEEARRGGLFSRARKNLSN